MRKRLFVWNYYGGKNRPVVQDWILSNLPPEYETYVEPFCGSLGILLNRPKSTHEVANDLNGRVINWWKVVVSSHRDELKRRVLEMPRSEQLFAEMCTTLDEGDDLERAIKFHYVVCISRMHVDEPRPSNFGHRLVDPKKSPDHHTATKHFDEVFDRVRRVTWLHRPAQKVLKRTADEAHCLIYCDPPYGSANTEPYQHVDLDGLTDLLKAQKGKVAISGYGDEWNHLGWRRESLDVWFSHGLKDVEHTDRTEVLWMNYEPTHRQEVLL